MKYKRRLFLGILGAIGMGFLLTRLLPITDFLQRFKVRFWPQKEPASGKLRKIVQLPEGGQNVSVETALNSRCTSDYDGHSKVFHWGIFDRDKKLSGEQIELVSGLARIPRFTNYRLDTIVDDSIIKIISEKVSEYPDREWLAIESGMLQQAVCLLCSAFGIGMVFKSYGESKPAVSETMQADIRLKLDAMKPSYGRDYWTDLPPRGRKSWVAGNLPEPARKSAQLMIPIMSELGTDDKGWGTELSHHLIGQLLWAARGRTPHYYKSKPWGMTVPTNRGEQDNTDVLLIDDRSVARYVNWQNDRPTHRVETIGPSSRVLDSVQEISEAPAACIAYKCNNRRTVSFWEIGYQLFNTILQSKALGLPYKAVLLSATSKQGFANAGVPDVVALVLYE